MIRAAILMFHPDPEKWVTGAYIKIGYFGDSDSDLRYQDEVHGPLILQADKAIELIYTKYMKALIDYEGLQRIETYMFPMEGFREILLNAINHKDYSTGITTTKRYFNRLCEIGVLEQKSADRSSYYERK